MRFLFIVILLSMPQASFAWRGTGHRIVCELAYQELTSSTRKEVDRLIAQDPEYATFADACNFPDRPRQRDTEHYINFPRDTDRVTTIQCKLADVCTFTAINADVRVLKRRSSTDLEKLTAIKFLGHWVGDLHQPLHVSFADDKGGNDVRVKGKCRGTMHSIWDACMLKARILEEPDKGPKVVRLAERWRARLTNAQRHKWTQDQISVWADESFQIAKAPQTRYCDQTGNKCIYDAPTGRQTYAGGAKAQVTANKAYISTQEPIIRQRLLQAGVRLGYLLNHSL